MPNLKAILFDLDGTLLDTSTFIGEAYDHAFDQYGVPRRAWDELLQVGSGIGHLEDIMRYFAPGIDPVALVQAFREAQSTRHHLIAPYVGVVEGLPLFREAGLQTAVLTNRSRLSLDKIYEALNFREAVDVSYAGDEVPATKPSPDGIAFVLDELGLVPEEVLMVGDADADIVAGKAAGTKTAGVMYGSFGQGIHEYQPDYVVHDIRDILPLINGGAPRTKEPVYVEAV